jgi:hypothetical protein
LEANSEGVADFMASLTAVVSRQIDRIIILPLHGTTQELATIEDAICFVDNYDEAANVDSFARYDIQVRYNNSNRVDGTFCDKESAINFLRTYQPLSTG